MSEVMLALEWALVWAGGVVLADALALPRAQLSVPPRSFAGTAMLLFAAALAGGVMLVITGALPVSVAATVLLGSALTAISNAKRKVLGEPLVFSDVALVGAVFQHPQFYVSALRPWQFAVLGGGFVSLIAAVALFSSAALAPRLAGAALALVAGLGLGILLRMKRWRGIAEAPDPEINVRDHGLIASLLVHWHYWRKVTDPAPCDAPKIAGQSRQLVVIVQCESFTDPAALFDQPELALPGLESARNLAWQKGRLLVPGFGAYTMRTEYGVLFGRDEAALGLRRFDPFLTAGGETSWALPNRLDDSEWASWFVHPHDLRFYGRDRLMPPAGFTALIGEDSFAAPAPEEGRYVTDAAIAERIIELAQDRTRAGLIYAVTIENHGPWPPGKAGPESKAAPYLELVGHSDAMLTRLLEALPQLERPVTLCFFGDHRPSIPGVIEPAAERHTPYVLMRFAHDGTALSGSGPDQDLTPAELHHAILAAIRSGEAEG